MRLIYIDSGLNRRAGHHYNICKSIIAMSEDYGIPIKILAHADIPADMVAELGAVPYFRYFTYWGTHPLRESLQKLRTIENAMYEDLSRISGLKSDDIVFVNSVMQPQLMAVARWASEMGPDAPTIIAEVFNKTDINFNENTYQEDYNQISDLFWLHVGDMLPPPEKLGLFLIAFNKSVSDIYSRILKQPVCPINNPLENQITPTNRSGKKIITVGLGGHQRLDKGYHHMVGILSSIMSEPGWENIRFHIHNSVPQEAAEIQNLLHRLANYDSRITLFETPLNGPQWEEFLDSLDLMICPYEPNAYKKMWSGLAVEAFCRGIPTILPNGSINSQFLIEKDADVPGFDNWTAQDIYVAIQKAVNNYDYYAARTYKAACIVSEEKKGHNFLHEIIEKFTYKHSS